MAEVQGLIISLEARTAQLERGLKRANDAQRKAAGQMERRAKQSADQIARSYESAGGRISQAFKSIALPKLAGLAGTVAGIGVAGGVAAVRQTVKGIAEIGDAAKRAGMQAEAFQEWSFVADQNRINVDALTDGFKELSLRADEFIVTGSGSAAEAFKRLGFSASELKGKLQDPNALMLEIIGRMEGLSKAAQIRIADELFGGTGGEQFVQLLDRGAAGISDQIARARDLGLVMDSDMIAKAAELDSKFREVETRLQTMWRVGAVEAGYFFGLIEREREKLTFDPVDTARLLGQGTSDALADLPEVPQDALAQVESLKIEYAQLADEARLLVPAMSDASSMLRGLGNEAGATALTELATRIGDAARAFEDGTITGEEYAAQLAAVVTEPLRPSDEDDFEAPEGRLLARLHVRRERNRELVKRKKAAAMRDTGRLSCEVCEFDFLAAYGERGRGFIECHHTVPVSSLGEGGRTSVKDLALVCANCHRMIHAGRPWWSIEEARASVVRPGRVD